MEKDIQVVFQITKASRQSLGHILGEENILTSHKVGKTSELEHKVYLGVLLPKALVPFSA